MNFSNVFPLWWIMLTIVLLSVLVKERFQKPVEEVVKPGCLPTYRMHRWCILYTLCSLTEVGSQKPIIPCLL